MNFNTRRFFIGVYLLFLIMLGLRPKIPFLFNNYFPTSSAGGWNMYQYLLEEYVECYLELKTGEKIPIEWKKYMYHSTFASSPHPNYRTEMGEEFCDYLIRHDKSVDSLRKTNTPFELKLKVNLIRENKDTLIYEYRRR